MSPLLSVITINRNNSAGLQRSIDSFRPYRGEPRIQFLFIDGASTDHSLNIGKSFYFNHEIISEPDNGIYDAMNKGWRNAVGEYVIWINSGDQLVQSLDFVWPYLQSKEADVYAFAVHESNLSSNSGNTVIPILDNLPHGMLQHQGLIFKNHLMKLYGGYNPRFKIAADRELLLKIYFDNLTIICLEHVISIFDYGGISKNNLYLAWENNLISKSFNLIGMPQFLYRCLRIKNEPFWGSLKKMILGGI